MYQRGGLDILNMPPPAPQQPMVLQHAFAGCLPPDIATELGGGAEPHSMNLTLSLLPQVARPSSLPKRNSLPTA